MSSPGNESLTGEEVVQVVENMQAVMDGEMDISTEAVEEAKELGLNPNQKAVAEQYAGEGNVTVHDSTTPNIAEKLLAGAELPWTFVLDGVQFVMKAPSGAGGNPSEWWWTESGYAFTYYKYDERENKVRIEEVDDD